MTEPTSLLRSFVAVPLPSAVQTEIAEAARVLAQELPQGDIKWSKRPENLHVTMKFLGPVAVDRLDALGAALGEALVEVPRFPLALRGWGAFPSLHDAKVVFADVEENDGARALTAVAEIVETVAARFGVPREERRFTGHVTVGRSKEGVDARAALAHDVDRAFGSLMVEEVHVYESQLGRNGDAGSTYVLRHRARLNARAN
jgi:RNA 2',3'-cyclic 3'-phosphodiesterase